MPKVVFDTNIYISAFITPGGRGEEAYQQAIEGQIQLYSSIPILTETSRKLLEKFKWERDMVDAAVRHIAEVAAIIRPIKRITVLADEPDNRILECAAEAGADLIVTGDKHLLKLHKYKDIAIVTLKEFFERDSRQI